MNVYAYFDHLKNLKNYFYYIYHYLFRYYLILFLLLLLLSCLENSMSIFQIKNIEILILDILTNQTFIYLFI